MFNSILINEQQIMNKNDRKERISISIYERWFRID